MAITITGGKYASAALASVGTTTITVTTTPFVSGDFGTGRRVDLYNSAGTTFKGMAFVRSYTSTSVLQLETEFFNPKTGSTVTQVTGDTILVSKTWGDVVQAGIAVSVNTVTITDTIVFGTSGIVSSVAFHDESMNVINNVVTANAKLYDVAGGFVTFGHLQSYTNKSFYNPCNFSFISTSSLSVFAATSSSARICIFGGSHRGQGTAPLYYTGGYSLGAYGTDWAHLWFLSVQLENIDILSKGAGGNWSTGTDHVLENCSYVGSGTNQILLRFGNGSVFGGQYKILKNSSNPISVFGSDSTGNYFIGAPANIRAIVLDIGNNNVLWRADIERNQNIYITNLISTDYRLGHGITPESWAATGSTKYIYFKDSFTNLNDATAVATIQDSTWTVDDSGTSSGSASTVAPYVLQSTATGHTVGTARGPWTYRIRKYGYDEQEGAITQASYSLGTAGTAYNVSFGGSILQIARTSLTGTAATALAYAGITVTDHGASPVSWNSKTWSITITVDLGTYPSRTILEVFKHIKAGIAQTASFNGKVGLLWHVLLEESGSDYVTQRGISGGAGASLKGVRIIDNSGNPFTGVIGMVADDGTTYTPPSADTRGLQFTGLVAGSTLKVFDTGTQTEAFSTTSSSTTETWSESASGSRTVDYTILKDGYIPIRVTGVVVTGALSGGVLTTTIQQQIDRAYVTSSGLTTGNATFNTGTKIFALTTASTVQNWYSFMIEQWRSNATLKNVQFPLVTNGPNSFSLSLDWEFNNSSSIAYLSRDGIRYVNTAGTQTAVWSAILTAGVPIGTQARYQQSDGGTTVNAQNTGNIDQLIQVYGDSSHGNFDKRTWLILKSQVDGYDEGVADVYTQYGALEDQLYVVGLVPTSNGLATGNPSVTGVTITDHGASPVTWNGKQFSITITDSASAHTGTEIMRWLRYNYQVGGTFQGKDGFNWHDLVKTNGSKFKTIRGSIYGDTGASLKGVRVVQNNGTSAHTDFDLFTADDGTTYAPPVSATITVSGATTGSRVQLYDTTNDVELYNGTPSFPYTYSETYVSDKAIRLRVSYCTASTANVFIDASIGSITSTALNLSYLVSPVVDSVYVDNAIDGTTITDCSITGTSLRVDINTGSTTWQHIYAFMTYWLYTSGGIRDQYLQMTAVDQTHYVFATAYGSFKIKNVSAPTAPLVVTGGNSKPDTGNVIDILDTTGGTIFCIEDTVVPFVYSTGSGLSTAEHNKLFSIPNDVWDMPTSSITTASTIGKTVKDNVPLIPAAL